MERATREGQDAAGRLEALETQVKALKTTAGIALLIGLALVLLGAAGPSGDVTARRFVLTDSSGVAKAVLATDSEGAPVFMLMDGASKPRVLLAVRGGTPSLYLTDGTDNPAIAMNVDADGAPTLRLRGSDLNSSVVLDVGKDGDPRVLIADTVGKTRAVLGASAMSVPSPSTAVRGGPPVNPAREPALVLLDGEGNVVFRAP